MSLVCMRYELNTTGKGRECGLFPLYGCYFSKVIPLFRGICQRHRNATPFVLPDGFFTCPGIGVGILFSDITIVEDKGSTNYTDVQRGERGSTEEHLTVTQFKVQAEQERLEQLREAVSEKQNDMVSLLSDLEVASDKLSTTEAELDTAKQKRDSIQEQYKALSTGMQKAEKYAAEFIRPPDEWLPTPTPLESAKGYRSRIIPMMAHFGKLLLKLYTQCVNLKEKCRQLVHRNENLVY